MSASTIACVIAAGSGNLTETQVRQVIAAGGGNLAVIKAIGQVIGAGAGNLSAQQIASQLRADTGGQLISDKGLGFTAATGDNLIAVSHLNP